MMNIMRVTPKSQVSILASKQPLMISSSNFNTSNQRTRYVFEDINNVDGAVHLFDQMLQRKPMPPVWDFCKLLNVIVKMKEYRQVVFMFKRLIYLDYPVNDYTMNIVVKCYCNLKRVKSGFAVVGAFLKRGYNPDTVTYNTLIYGLCKLNRLDEAEGLLRGMVGADVITYNALMKGYYLSEEPDKAKGVWNLMTEKGVEPNLVSYCVMINGYCKGKDIDEAWVLFKEMPLKGLKPDIAVYNCLIQGLFSEGRCSQAMELFHDLKLGTIGCDIYTYGIVLDGLFKNGKIDDATSIYHEVDRKGLAEQVSFYNTYMDGLCDNNQVDLALSIFNNLSLKGLSPDLITYNVMIKGLCREGMLHEVKELLDRMRKSGCFPNKVTYNTIIQGCLKRYGSLDILSQIVAKDFSLDATTFSILLQQMQGMDEDNGRKILIQELISIDSKCLMA